MSCSIIQGIYCLMKTTPWEYSIARIIWPSLIHMPRIICTIILDTTLRHWLLHWHPNFAVLILFQIYVKIFTLTWLIPSHHEFFIGLRFILWGHWLPLFWTLCNPPHGFNARVVLSLALLYAVNLRVNSGAKAAFTTNRRVNCVSVYGRLAFLTSNSGGQAAT